MNHSMSKIVLGFAAIMPLSGLTGCVVRERDYHRREVIVVDEPPPPRREVIIERERPSRDHLWIEGHWVRERDRWEWFGGHWEARPRREAEWVPGHHERREHGYVWIEGHWR